MVVVWMLVHPRPSTKVNITWATRVHHLQAPQTSHTQDKLVMCKELSKTSAAMVTLMGPRFLPTDGMSNTLGEYSYIPILFLITMGPRCLHTDLICSLVQDMHHCGYAPNPDSCII